MEPFAVTLPWAVDRLYTVPYGWVAIQGNELRFAPGYAWDGASGLTVDTPNTMVPALGHDGLYQLMREGGLPLEYREKADALLRDMMIERGVWKVRAWAWYWAVRKFAGPAATEPKLILDAP